MADYGSNMPQEGDVLHYAGANSGEIKMANGDLVMTTGIEPAIYDCLFGGNKEDDGSKATEKLQYWGNEDEPMEYQSRGRLQSILDGRPVTSFRLVQFEEAARDDIVTQMPRSVVKAVSVSVSSTSPKMIDMVIDVTMFDGSLYTISYKGILV